MPRWGWGVFSAGGQSIKLAIYRCFSRRSNILHLRRSNLIPILRYLKICSHCDDACFHSAPGFNVSKLYLACIFLSRPKLIFQALEVYEKGDISLFTDPAHRPRRKSESCKRLPKLGLVPARRSVTSGSARAHVPWAEPWGCLVGESLAIEWNEILALTSVLGIVTYRGDNQR